MLTGGRVPCSSIYALTAAGLLMLTLSCYSADEPYTGQSKAEKPGRAGEEKQAVKSKPDPNKPGRTGEEKQAVKSEARPEQVRPRRRGKAGSQGRRSSRESWPHGREEQSSIQGPSGPGRKRNDFVSDARASSCG